MRPVFIGNEVTAAGYRLAGLEARTPAPGQERAAVYALLAEEPPLVLLSMEIASALPETELFDILARLEPPVLPVADATGRVPVADLAARIRSGIIA